MGAKTIQPDRSGILEGKEHTIHWEYFGQRDKELICLLNGLALSTKSWYSFLPLLKEDFDVLLFDFPGQGSSSDGDVPCSIPQIAEYLRTILDTVEVERAHLMGVSFGGFVAADFARLHHDRLHTMTLSGILLTREKLFDRYQDLSLDFYKGGSERFDLYTKFLYERIFGEGYLRKAGDRIDVMRERFNEIYGHRPHCLARLTEAQVPFFESLEENQAAFRCVPTPTLVIAGSQDLCVPPWIQRKISNILPDARYFQIEDAGHVVYLEEPESFFGTLKRFCHARATDF